MAAAAYACMRPPTILPGSPPGPAVSRLRPLKGQLSAHVSSQTPLSETMKTHTVIRLPDGACKADELGSASRSDGGRCPSGGAEGPPRQLWLTAAAGQH